jgi:hypothetical protein
MPTIKINVSHSEHDLLKKWAKGAPLAPLIKRLALYDAEGLLGTLPGYSEGTDRALPKKEAEGPPRVPTVPSQGTAKSGTDRASINHRKKKSREDTQKSLPGSERPPFVEPVVSEIVSHFNETVGLSLVAADPTIRDLILFHLAHGYTKEDFFKLHVWADKHWPDKTGPDGKNWRKICVVPSFLYSKDRIGGHMGHAKAPKKKTQGYTMQIKDEDRLR